MLTVYTATHCPVYTRTWSLVAQLNQHHPRIPVQVINLDDPSIEWPSFIIGTPTYMWNEQVIFLGNPSETDLICELSKIQAI
jgi:hypothetical protein